MTDHLETDPTHEVKVDPLEARLRDAYWTQHGAELKVVLMNDDPESLCELSRYSGKYALRIVSSAELDVFQIDAIETTARTFGGVIKTSIVASPRGARVLFEINRDRLSCLRQADGIMREIIRMFDLLAEQLLRELNNEPRRKPCAPNSEFSARGGPGVRDLQGRLR